MSGLKLMRVVELMCQKFVQPIFFGAKLVAMFVSHCLSYDLKVLGAARANPDGYQHLWDPRNTKESVLRLLVKIPPKKKKNIYIYIYTLL